MPNILHKIRISLAVGLVAIMFIGSFSLLNWLTEQPYFPWPQPTPSQTPTTNEKLTLLGNPFSGYSTFRNQEFKEKLKEAGLNFEFRDEPDQVKRFESLQQGKADLLVTSLDQFLIHRKGNEKIVGLIDRSVGADAVVLNNIKYPDLKSLNDLRKLVKPGIQQNFTIAFAENTPSEYLALVLSDDFPALRLSNFQEDKVKQSKEAWERLQDRNQNVAVAVLWEPDITDAKENQYKVLLSSYHLPNTIIDVVVASDRLINSQRQTIVNFLKKYYTHMDSGFQKECSKLQEQIRNDAKDARFSPNDAKKVLESIYFFSSVEAKEWMTNKKLEERIEHTVGVLKRKNIDNALSNEPATKLFDRTFIEEAVKPLQKAESDVKLPSGNDCISNNRSIGIETTVGDLAGENIEYEGRKDIQFNSGLSQLTEDGKKRLDEIAQKIAEYNPDIITVKVIGHTSKTGNLAPQYNQNLSEERAKAVKNHLETFKDKLEAKLKLTHKIEYSGEGYNKSIEGTRPEDESNQRTEILLQIVKKIN